jgi:hypothetical protein
LNATRSLLQEALATAVEKDVDGTLARVFTAEHIAAVALETGRAKNKARVLQFVEAGALDLERLQEILARRRLATLPSAEKLRMLDALRVRTLAIRRASISGATKRH